MLGLCVEEIGPFRDDDGKFLSTMSEASSAAGFIVELF